MEFETNPIQRARTGEDTPVARILGEADRTEGRIKLAFIDFRARRGLVEIFNVVDQEIENLVSRSGGGFEVILQNA